MSVAGIMPVEKVTNNLILRHPKKVYQEHINDLDLYVSQLDTRISNMRQYRNELPQFWEGESADRYATLLEIELSSLENARAIVSDDIAFYTSLISDLDSTTGSVSSAIDDATTALNALNSELGRATGTETDGGYNGIGGEGSLKGSLSFDKNKQSFWNEQWADIKDAWHETGHAFNWLEKQYNKVPEDIRGKLESVFPTGSAATKITSDIVTNDLNMDTLKTFMKSIGTSNSTISAVTNTIKVVTDDNSIALRSVDRMDAFGEVAEECLINGDVGGFFMNIGKGLGVGVGGAVFGGAADTLTEMASGAVDVTLNKVFGVTGMVGEIIPGNAGEVISNLSEGGVALTGKFTGWLSNLL